MKLLKSSLHDLRDLFGSVICVREITEHLVSFDGDHSGVEAAAFMAKRNFDVIGVRENGVVVGFTRQIDEPGLLVRDSKRIFSASDMIEASDSLTCVLEHLKQDNYVFVRILGHVGGIVTRGDLQKAPFRMWLFGLVSLIEMHLLRILRAKYPLGEWKSKISAGRLQKAMEFHKDRVRRNIECDPADCLQFSDKVDILIGSEEFRHLLGFESRSASKRFFDDIRKLRDDLAHSGDIVSPRWPRLIGLTKESERVLSALERLEIE